MVTKILEKFDEWLAILNTYWHLVGSPGDKDKAKEGMMKAGLFGLGEKDELLFATAVAYATANLNAPMEGMKKVLAVITAIADLPTRSKIVRWIGQTEEEIEVAVNVAGKPVTEKRKVNVKGAEVIAFLARPDMSEDDVRNFLNASGVTVTLEDELNWRWQKVKTAFATDGPLHSAVRGVVDAINSAAEKIPAVEDPGLFHGVFGTEINLIGRIRDWWNRR